MPCHGSGSPTVSIKSIMSIAGTGNVIASAGPVFRNEMEHASRGQRLINLSEKSTSIILSSGPGRITSAILRPNNESSHRMPPFACSCKHEVVEVKSKLSHVYVLDCLEGALSFRLRSDDPFSFSSCSHLLYSTSVAVHLVSGHHLSEPLSGQTTASLLAWARVTV